MKAQSAGVWISLALIVADMFSLMDISIFIITYNDEISVQVAEYGLDGGHDFGMVFSSGQF